MYERDFGGSCPACRRARPSLAAVPREHGAAIPATPVRYTRWMTQPQPSQPKPGQPQPGEQGQSAAAKLALHPRLPGGAGAVHPGLVHAPGGAVAARVQERCARASRCWSRCTRPELVTEITLQPLRRYDVDAAILFSDIVVPLRAIGVDVDIKPGVGPVVGRPFRTIADVERLRPLEPDDVPYISEAVKSLVGDMGGKPLIGFAGGPFTLDFLPHRGRPVEEP